MNCWTFDDRQGPLPSRFGQRKKLSGLCSRRLDRDRIVRRQPAALRLPDKDRLHLADKILGSLPAPLAPAELEEILAEAIRRDAELESGEVLPLAEEAFWAGVRHRSA
jgi:hypothetical protein